MLGVVTEGSVQLVQDEFYHLRDHVIRNLEVNFVEFVVLFFVSGLR